MQLYTSLAIITFFFFIQLHVFQYMQYATPNILLIYYVYSIHHQGNAVSNIYNLYILELLSCIYLDLFGLVSLFLLPLSYLLIKIKKYFHFTFIAPCLIITSFTVCYTLACNIGLPIHISWKTSIQQIVFNCILYIMIDFINKTKKRAT